MIARFHYDDSRLTQLLQDEGSVGSHELLEHLETCEECQARLDTLSSGGLSWDEVNELMRKDDPKVAELVGRYDEQREEPDSLATSATFLRPSDYPDSLGRFARYEVLEFLGRGGMGIVIKAYDTALQRNCAVKVLAPELASSAAARRRFSREARSAAAVVHPHVVPIQTVDEHNGLPYLVMPVVIGRSLQQRVEADGPLSVVETVRIASQVAEGLAAAHAQGLVHRDIKPANILLENSVERVQLTDFGLARAIDDASMTRSGVIAGTPQYMSPEQAHGDPIDHRSDLFSLGSVMYFMLTGRSPFRAETTMGVLNRIGNDQPRSLRSINAEVPEWLEAIVMKLLSKSRDERFATAEEVAALLSGCLAHLQEPTTTPLPVGTPSFNDKPQASARSQFSESLNPSRLQLAVQRMGQPPIRWLVAAAAFAFFAITGTIIYLETSKGTLRIESNGEADVPVIIRQGEKVVEHLTVSSEGVNHRLHAGQYTIEIEGNRSDVSIIGNQVQLKRGETWVANVRWETQQTNPSISHSGPLNNSIDGHAKHGGIDTRSQTQISPDLFNLKSNVLSMRGEGLHRDSSDIKVDLSSDVGIDHRFNESPLKREPLPTSFLVDSFSGGPIITLIDISDRVIDLTAQILCADATEKFWNRIRGQKVNLHVSQEDFDTVVAGNEVTKVVYMPDGNSDLLDTLVSSRVDPGIDVFEEANRRGQAVVSIHLKPSTQPSAGPDFLSHFAIAATKIASHIWKPASKQHQRDDPEKESTASPEFPPVKTTVHDEGRNLSGVRMGNTAPRSKAVSDDRKNLFVHLHSDIELLFADPTKPHSEQPWTRAGGIELPFSLDKPGTEACYHIVDRNFQSIRAVVRLECSEFLPKEYWQRLGEQQIELSVSRGDFTSVLSGNLQDTVVYLPDEKAGDLLQTKSYSGIGRPNDVVDDVRKMGGQPLVSIRLDPPTSADQVAKSHRRIGPNFSSGRSTIDFFNRCSDEELLQALQGSWAQPHFNRKVTEMDKDPNVLHEKPLRVTFEGTTFHWNNSDSKANSPKSEKFTLSLSGPSTPRKFSLDGNDTYPDGLKGVLILTPEGELSIGLGREPVWKIEANDQFLIKARRLLNNTQAVQD